MPQALSPHPLDRTFTLYDINSGIRQYLEDVFATPVWVQAEIAECSVATNGHCYMELVQKDLDGHSFVARARATIWANRYRNVAATFAKATGERLRAGLQVRLKARVTFHEVYGYSLNVTDIDPAYTLGDMAQRRRQILGRLEREGVLADNKGLPLPTLLKRIAVVSSGTAAGYGDFCDQLLHNGYGLAFTVELFQAYMQGEQTGPSVARALADIIECGRDWDCVVIIRGGGATSDLSDFDDYTLAYTITQMPLPVIVGIGHERDQTALDFVAHTSVKTPTAAAAFILQHQVEQLARVEAVADLLPRAVAAICQQHRHRLDVLASQMAMLPQRRLNAGLNALDRTEQRLHTALRQLLMQHDFRLRMLAQRLAALDPQRQLERGYSLTYTADGRLLRTAGCVRLGDVLTTRLATGTLRSTVTENG